MQSADRTGCHLEEEGQHAVGANYADHLCPESVAAAIAKLSPANSPSAERKGEQSERCAHVCNAVSKDQPSQFCRRCAAAGTTYHSGNNSYRSFQRFGKLPPGKDPMQAALQGQFSKEAAIQTRCDKEVENKMQHQSSIMAGTGSARPAKDKILPVEYVSSCKHLPEVPLDLRQALKAVAAARTCLQRSGTKAKAMTTAESVAQRRREIRMAVHRLQRQ